MILAVYSRKRAASELVAEYALKLFSELSVNTRYARAEYTHDATGAPMFDVAGAPFVSVSHSADIVVAAVSDEPVGIDVQFKKQVDYAAISARFGIKADTSDDFYAAFTAAEAKTKALRIPLAESLKGDNSDVAVFDFIPGYTLAVSGSGTPYFAEYYDASEPAEPRESLS